MISSSSYHIKFQADVAIRSFIFLGSIDSNVCDDLLDKSKKMKKIDWETDGNCRNRLHWKFRNCHCQTPVFY